LLAERDTIEKCRVLNATDLGPTSGGSAKAPDIYFSASAGRSVFNRPLFAGAAIVVPDGVTDAEKADSDFLLALFRDAADRIASSVPGSCLENYPLRVEQQSDWNARQPSIATYPIIARYGNDSTVCPGLNNSNYQMPPPAFPVRGAGRRQGCAAGSS
jgi:hypothetical protein